MYAELFASGNGQEEFWYFDPVNGFYSHPYAGTAYGNGPFREVRLLIDGKLAGVAFPYAVIFTGGIIPAAWRLVLHHFILSGSSPGEFALAIRRTARRTTRFPTSTPKGIRSRVSSMQD